MSLVTHKSPRATAGELAARGTHTTIANEAKETCPRIRPRIAQSAAAGVREREREKREVSAVTFIGYKSSHDIMPGPSKYVYAPFPLRLSGGRFLDNRKKARPLGSL